MDIPKTLKLPNPTTIIAFFIVFISFFMITSFAQLFSVLIGLLLFILALRESYEYIDRFIRENALKETSSFPNIQKEIEEIQEKLGVEANITLLVSDSSGESIVTLGRIKHVFVTMNSKVADALESNTDLRKPVLCHEIAHVYFGDHWKVIFVRQVAKLFFIFSLLVVSMGIFSYFGMRQLLVGSQLMAAAHVISLVSNLLLYIAMLLLVGEIISSREFFADFLTSHYFGTTVLFQARVGMTQIGAGIDTKIKNVIARLMKIFSRINRRDRVDISKARVIQKYLWINLWGGIVAGSLVWSLEGLSIVVFQFLLILVGTLLSAYSTSILFLEDDAIQGIKPFLYVCYSVLLFFCGALVFPVVQFVLNYAHLFWGLPLDIVAESNESSVYAIFNIVIVFLILLPGVLMAMYTAGRLGRRYLENRLDQGNSLVVIGVLSCFTWMYASFLNLASLSALDLLNFMKEEAWVVFLILAFLYLLLVGLLYFKNRRVAER